MQWDLINSDILVPRHVDITMNTKRKFLQEMQNTDFPEILNDFYSFLSITTDQTWPTLTNLQYLTK